MASDTQAQSDGQALFDRFELNEVGVLVTPTVLWFAVFLGLPLLLILVYSFLTYESFNVLFEFTTSPWEQAFRPTVVNTLVSTLILATAATALTLLFGYPLAYYLRFYASQTGGIILLLFLVIPFWTSALIRTLGWIPVLGKGGVVNQILIWIGVVNQPVEWLLFSRFSMLVGYLAAYVVFMAAPIYISLAQIDEDLLDASETLRGDPVTTFRKVTFPLSKPGVTIGVIFVFVLSVGDFIIPQFLSGGTGTITTLIFISVNSGLNYPNASALSIMLLVVIFVIVYGLTRIVDISDIART